MASEGQMTQTLCFNMNKYFSIIRWFSVIPVAFISSYLAAWLGIGVQYLTPDKHGIEIIGAFISSSFIIGGSIVAPSKREYISVILFVTGVVLTWGFLSSYKEADSVTPDYIPLIYTYASGLITCIVVIIYTKKHNQKIKRDDLQPPLI